MKKYKTPKEIRNLFSLSGSFKTEGYDPYRVSEEHREFHNQLFDEDGYCKISNEYLSEIIESRNCHWTSDVVTLFYAKRHGSTTSGSYPAVYMWR